MGITTISSREFNRDTGGAIKAAANGPVFIADRDRPAHVLLTYEAYRKLAGKDPSLAEALRQKEEEAFEFDPPRMGDGISRPVDFD